MRVGSCESGKLGTRVEVVKEGGLADCRRPLNRTTEPGFTLTTLRHWKISKAFCMFSNASALVEAVRVPGQFVFGGTGAIDINLKFIGVFEA
ncbi:hypothetical protein BpHYR1_044901 [Brachionus plicatilis]|uniref:Uncharacterized protein n=1 Tax=Brachionus plicatilis TaxID=10195 RepID=A0A3M7P2I2_BRAPC|nr:hypothetical protein BpHYR1_044901 [Brachionus plicatilis]